MAEIGIAKVKVLSKPIKEEQAEEEPAAHIKWLIDNYNPPRHLLWRSWDLKKDEDPMIEAAAKVYTTLKPPGITFIEWLWKNFPPTPEFAL